MNIDPDDIEEWNDFRVTPREVEATRFPMEVELNGETGKWVVREDGELFVYTDEEFQELFSPDDERFPEYSPKQIREAQREFRENTLDHVPTGTTDTDARAGMRAFLSILR